MFNCGPLPAMITRGELEPLYLRDSHLTNPEDRGELPCTRGQMIRYSAPGGHWVVETFHFERHGGGIGASGLHDPKRINEGDTIFVAKVKPSAMMTP